MTLQAYPSTLPAPASLSLKPTDIRSAPTSESGPSYGSRGRQLEMALVADVSWDLSYEQYATFIGWHASSLAGGRRKFLMHCDGPGGRIERLCRITSSLKADHIAGIGYSVSATLLVMEGGGGSVTPPPPPPAGEDLSGYTMALAFEGQPGSKQIVDSINASRVLIAVDSAILSSAQKYAGDTSLKLGVWDGGAISSVGLVDAQPSAQFAFEADFTIEGRLRYDVVTGGWARVCETQEYDIGGGWLICLRGSDPANARHLLFQLTQDGGGGANIASDAAIQPDVWTKFAITRRAGVISMFIDGQKQSGSLAHASPFTAQELRIGATLGKPGYPHGTPDNFLFGYLDNFRIASTVAKYV